MKISAKRLKNIASRFKSKNILVVGDVILDHYIFGSVNRISPEAPVPVVWANGENFVCGGSANVGLNLISLGANASLCGVLGNDHFGGVLLNLAKSRKIATGLLIKDSRRPTTLKTRIIANHQQVVRLDWESVEYLELKTNSKIYNRVLKSINSFDAVIIEDYGKGVINPSLVDKLVQLCKKKNKIITVDPKEDHFDYYRDVTALTPNLKEAEAAASFKVRGKEQIALLGDIIKDKLNPKALLITLGEGGMMLFEGKRRHHIPTAALEVFDVSGAGDTVIAAFTLALCCGAAFYEAAVIANFCAGIVVGKSGTATASQRELKKKISE
ncbi:MAG: D-glycero-beta-D-manno-heptose-7-phosphate kinase [Candidatus Omnitrophota bacterium]